MRAADRLGFIMFVIHIFIHIFGMLEENAKRNKVVNCIRFHVTFKRDYKGGYIPSRVKSICIYFIYVLIEYFDEGLFG